MKVLVLGGCGFIGSYLVDTLQGEGHEVVVLDRQPERFREPRQRVTYFYGDFSDRMLLVEAMAGVEAVCHLVSTTFPGTANLDPSSDVAGNLIGTLTLLDTMRSVGVRRLVYMSSGGTVYGRPKAEPIPESHPLEPINSYGIVKVAVEHYLWMYQAVHGLQPVAVRAANPFGPRQGHTDVQGVISTFLRKVLNGQDIEIWGDGSVVRDYLHAGDVADLCARALTSDFVGPVNAGSGQGRSLNDVLASVRRVTGHDVQPIFKPGRRIDVARSVLDVTRARDEFGWYAQRDFDEALSETWAWMQSQEAS